MKHSGSLSQTLTWSQCHVNAGQWQQGKDPNRAGQFISNISDILEYQLMSNMADDHIVIFKSFVAHFKNLFTH